MQARRGNSRQYRVDILRDAYGVPHIYGQRDIDAAFGLAYAHTEDDFETIQSLRLLAASWRAILGLTGWQLIFWSIGSMCAPMLKPISPPPCHRPYAPICKPMPMA